VERTEQAYFLNRLLVHIILGITALAFVIALILRDLVFYVLVAREYRSAAHLLPWMLLAGGLFAAGQAAALNLMTSLQSRSLVVPKVATAILGVVVNYFGATLFGISGVVTASVFFSAAYLLWIYALTATRRHFVKDI
jgi:O-antigen/teichoic acid export membrane protein